MNPVVIGTVAGLAWAASLRGFMVEVAGQQSSVSWLETFAGILLPGAVAGGLLGWAEHRRRISRAAPPCSSWRRCSCPLRRCRSRVSCRRF